MADKQRGAKYRFFGILFALLFLGLVWLTNLIWFRPFNIRHFYDKVFVKYALLSPEKITQLGIPVLYDYTKDELDNLSDVRLRKDFEKSKRDYATLLSYNYSRQSPANQLNTKILSAYMKGGIDGEPFFYHGYLLADIIDDYILTKQSEALTRS